MPADFKLHPFHVMDILARARQMEADGREVVHMEIGEPDFSSPEPVIQAGINALKDNKTFYTPATGLISLRQRISEYYRDVLKVSVDSEQVIITPGAAGALQLLFAYVLRSGRKIMIADPNYPCNRNLPVLYEGEALSVAVDAATQYQLSRQLVIDNWQDDVSAVLVASPSNPTGTICGVDQLLAIADFLAQKNRFLIVDEIYQGLTYESAAQTVANLRDNIFVINSFSKYFGMTGWRVGWLVAPYKYLSVLDAIAQNTFLAASTVAQYAAMAAFQEDTIEVLEQRRIVFKQRRDLVCEQLADMQVEIPVIPQGAFYIYANIAQFTTDSFSFCKKLLEQQGVAITPGCDFGEHRANEYVRFAFTTEETKLQEGMQRLQSFIHG